MSSKNTELLVNGGFESGVLAPWTVVFGTAAVSNAKRQFEGNFVAVMDPNSAIRQVVSKGLEEEIVYRLTGSLADDNTTSGIDSPENPTTVVTLQFIDKNGTVLQTFTKTFNRLTLPEMNEGNYRVFNLLAQAPEHTKGAIVTITIGADGFFGTEGIIVDEFSLIQENDD
ncbi:hypothetical protein [Bacillus sp. AFS055030]|uniref:hypothetical protein n=1 Tax=Bacillus sp. AFS055030 TaxID=2033507 RepID=UPI000BFDC1B8|nr:hypothetical protein [Bacillus sp. AFS055030]PGL73024.1 hypothetical protein CN925_02275 [Bacillus sp. AFS055030]